MFNFVLYLLKKGSFMGLILQIHANSGLDTQPVTCMCLKQ
jgi:hypothetical protein